MAVNLSKNGPSLMAAYKEVVDGKSDTNWALFTYEGNSNDIRLAEKGEGGLEEMVEELSSGKVMYAFCRVQDPNSGLPKYVLINWTGEGVKDIRKGICANHVTSMANFLRGAHVTVNARTEDDVEPESILKTVAKASGASFDFLKQTKHYIDVPTGPVGSVYQKVNAVQEIQQTNRENFWSQAERDERVRQQEESRRVQLEKEMLERDRREMDDRRERERREKELERERIYQNQREEEERRRQRQEAHVTVDAGVDYGDMPIGSVGSVYQKVNAREEIQQTNKDDFWSRAERDEKSRRQEEARRVQQEKERMERERRELDEKQTRERERREKERALQIERGKIYENQREEEERLWQQQRQGGHVTVDAGTEYGDMPVGSVGSVYQKVNAREEIQQTNKDDFWSRAERDEKSRRQEEARRVQQEKERMERERRELDEKQTRERERREKERALQIDRERIYENQREEEERERQQQQNLQENTNKWTGISLVPSVKKANEAQSLIAQRSSNPRDIFKSWERSTEANGSLSPPASQPGRLQSPFVSQKSTGRVGPLYPPALSETPLFPTSTTSPVLSYSPAAASDSPVPGADAVYLKDGEWSDEFEDYANEDNPAETSLQEDIYEPVQPAGMKQEDIYENVHTSSAEGNKESNICVRALYDYQAADETEITFDPDDIITGVEMLDEGWWRGYGPDGRYGMFPSNYVELL